METPRLPESIEQIAQKAEGGAAELARSAITLGFELLTSLVEEVRSESHSDARSPSEPSERAGSANGRFLSLEEAAEFLRLKSSTLYSWVGNDKIPYSKVGSRILFEREALIEFVKASQGRTGKHRSKHSQTPLQVLK